MENQTDTSTQSETSGTFGDRFRLRAKEVKAQLDAAEARAKARWAEVPGKLRSAFAGTVSKVRVGLDLPSRSEVSSLAQRLEELDRKLGEYETQSTGKKRKPADSSPSTSA
jgi:Poly(hydroxyalcanoate) granule associated protein (phasin)